VILYFFNIRTEFLEGAPKSSTAFFTVPEKVLIFRAHPLKFPS